MSIVNISGSVTSTSSQSDQPRRLSDSLVDQRVMLDGNELTDRRLVRDSLINNTALDVDTFNTNKSLVAGYVQGQIIKVTYFSRNTPPSDIQSQQVDLITAIKDDTELSLTQIRDMELRLQQSIDYSFEDEENISKSSGTALTWPGFVPRIGEVFFYEIRNGIIGIFVVTKIERLVLGQETYHNISFSLQQPLTPELRRKYQAASVRVCYFDKVKYLTGDTAFLTHTDYLAKQHLIELRPAIIRRYIDEYYSTQFSSFIRPDGKYDPYVVEFWNRKVNISEEDVRPCQLLVTVSNYKRTIWSMMTGNPIKSFKNLEYNACEYLKVGTYWDAGITALLGSRYITVGREDAAKTHSWIDNKTGRIANLERDPARHPAYDHRDYVFHREQFLKASDEINKLVDDFERKNAVQHTNKYQAPYPIVSNGQLRTIWRKMNGYSKDDCLDEDQLATAAGYIDWYRKKYSGTLSKYELEEQWRAENNIKGSLTRQQILKLAEYIKSYRAKYPTVYSNEEIATLYAIQHKFQEYTDLDVQNEIRNYREMHGYVPDDSYDKHGDSDGDPDKITHLSVIFTDRDTDVTIIRSRPETNPDEDKPYVKYYALSKEFYLGGAMDGIERAIYDALHGKVNPEHICQVVDDVLQDQMTYHDDPDVLLRYFYLLPMMLYLIDQALRELMKS